MNRPPLPPFSKESAIKKVGAAGDAWNNRYPARVALAFAPYSRWRNQVEFLRGRTEFEVFLTRKWAHELDYRLIKELWNFAGNRISVRFAYKFHDDRGQWSRAYGKENWQFDAGGLMKLRFANINERPIAEAERKLRWPFGRRLDAQSTLKDLGL
jgi:nuclear transport factor 2 (NTF2) superfamily protein